MKHAVFGLILAVIPGLALAGDTSVVGAKAVRMGGGWRFDVTLRHADTGWDHYADGWGVYTPDGKQIAYRDLLHPHVDEQPFTRSLTGVKLPAGLSAVVIRGHDNVHGFGKPYTLTLP